MRGWRRALAGEMFPLCNDCEEEKGKKVDFKISSLIIIIEKRM